MIPPLILREGDRDRLNELMQPSPDKAPRSARLALRAQMMLLAADGYSNTEVGDLVGVARQTVIRWRKRYESCGIAGLSDGPRPGRPPLIDPRVVVAATLEPPPDEYSATRWTTRLMAQHLDIAHATVSEIWRKHGLKPWEQHSIP